MKKNPNILLVIPARYDSKRFPGKSLCYLSGKNNIKKTLIERTWLLAKSLKFKCKIIIATDDERIKSHSENFGAKVIIYDPFMGTGTTAYVAKKMNRKYIGSEIGENYYNFSIERLSQIDNEINF